MNFFGSLYQTAQRQRLCLRKFAHRRQPGFAQLLGAATGVPTDQPNEAVLLPSMAPVVDRLMADAALLPNRRRMFAFAQHQQTRCSQPRIPPGMIDRQLEQGFAFAGTQFQRYFHRRLSGVRA